MLARRPWVPDAPETYIQALAAQTSGQSLDAIDAEVHRLAAENRTIHERDCVNLNPATNVMNPRAEALLAQGLGSRPSLGYPGDAITRRRRISAAMSRTTSKARPASGLIVTNEPELAERFDAIAFPGLTVNFDAAKSAALALTLLDWKAHGEAYAQAMVDTTQALVSALVENDVPLFQCKQGYTSSQHLALSAAPYGGGQAAAKRLRRANILSCGIGLPIPAVDGDLNGLRLGTPEIVRWGMSPADMPELARLLARALDGNQSPETLAPAVTAFRSQFTQFHHMRIPAG